jgi:hypothetical protein
MGFPANPPVGEPHEGWEWDGEKWVAVGSEIDANIEDGTTDGQITTWAGDKWSPNDAVTVNASGNVGIGTSSPGRRLSIEGEGSDCRVEVKNKNTNARISVSSPDSGSPQISFDNGLLLTQYGSDRLTIDSNGKVGIGMAPLRSTAKEQLAEWKASFDARLKAEPKADKKAVTLEITDDAFEVLPTEEAVAEWMETRAAGDRLQVNGNGSFSGNITTNHHIPNTTASYDLGSPSLQWRGGHFSGTVNAQRTIVSDAGTTRIDLNDTSNATGKKFLRSNQGRFDIVSHDYSTAIFIVDNDGNGTFHGTLKVEGTRPVSTKADLIEILSTLRNATKDETTLEGMRDALSDAIGGIIQDLEHQISTMPAEDSNE